MLVGIEFWSNDRLISVRRDRLGPEDKSERLPYISKGKLFAAPWGLQPTHPLAEARIGRHNPLPTGWTVPRKIVQGWEWMAHSPLPVKIPAASFITVGENGQECRTCLRPGEFIQAAYIEQGIGDRLYVVVVLPPKGLEHTATEWPRIVGRPTSGV